MANIQEVFERKETKYVITPMQYEQLLKFLRGHIEKDIYYEGTNCSVYYDTPTFELVSHSLEKPIFKQKFRIRSYGVPRLNDYIFLEIKKKFKGVNNKRRIRLKLEDFYKFIRSGELIADNPIIEREVAYWFNFYNLRPSIYIAYKRFSYCSVEDSNFRLTFDFDLRSRLDHLRLEAGDYGQSYFGRGEIIMEAKTIGSFPPWFISTLSQLCIYPTSFQKYGYTYQKRFPEIANKLKKEKIINV